MSFLKNFVLVNYQVYPQLPAIKAQGHLHALSLALRRKNKEMQQKFLEEGSSAVLTNLVGRSFTSLPDPKTAKETKDKVLTQEMDGESHPNKSVRTIWTSNSVHRHPFTDSIVGVPLSNKWKGFNMDCYDDTTNPDEHMDAYIMHMSFYTKDDTVLCLVFPISLKGGALSWFTKLPPNSVDSFATLMS